MSELASRSPASYGTSPATGSTSLIQVNDPAPSSAHSQSHASNGNAYASNSAAPTRQPAGEPPKARRAFKACAHCRSRKAKCDLGDLNNPHDPPCTRCRREGVVCEFLPSRRGGRVPFNSQKKERDEHSPRQSSQPIDHYRRRNVSSVGSRDRGRDEYREDSTYEDDGPEEVPTVLTSSAMGHIGSLSAISVNRPHDFSIVPAFPPNEIGRAALRFPPTIPVPPPISSSDIFRHPRGYSNSGNSPSTSNPKGQEASDASPTETASGASEGSGMPRKKKRRLSGGPIDPETLAAASLRNPIDALNLLVLAADGGENVGLNEGEMMDMDEVNGGDLQVRTTGDSTKSETSPGTRGEGASVEAEKPEPPPPSLEDFPLVKRGVLTVKKLCELVDVFFSRVHFIFPICPYQRVPRTEAQLAKLASEELHLVTVFIVIASRHDKNPRVHDKSWAYLQTLINDIILGKNVGVGAVEALLLLSEYLPRQTDVVASKLNAEENRMSWMLVGTAVRLGYMLGLDQKTLLPTKPLLESTSGTAAEELLNRERVAWTYCYLFDRQISVRTGKAFWSRGPGLCFTGGAGGVYPTAARNFPAMRFIPDIQDDFASLLQAYVELTQIMTSAHDILYPSKDRTISLIKLGEYYKYIDEFQRSLEAFRMTWEGKRWATYPLTECIWITFHYLRLYIYAFAFQAHIQRATMNDGSDDGPPTVLFPAGLVASPDAKFILEAIDAAADLLRLVTDRLHPGGALPFLPWRFFMMFSYAGVFLLKAVYVEAVAPLDRTVIIRLLKRLIFVLACASTDEQHPGVRYARLLNGLLRAFSHGQESMVATRAPTPARRNSLTGGEGPEPPTNTIRQDLDFMSAFVGASGTASTGVSPSVVKDQPESSAPTPAAGPSATDNLFPSTFGNSLFNPSFTFNPTGLPMGASPSQPHLSSGATPFPMLPFSESQPFHQLANALDSSLDFDFGFEDPELPAPAPAEAFNFLLEDSALDFWNSFSGDGDWTQQASGGV